MPTRKPNATDGRVDGSKTDFMSAKALKFYREQGYLVVEKAISPAETELIKGDAANICRGKYGEFDGFVGPHDDQPDDEVLGNYLCIHFPHKISHTMFNYLSPPAIVEALKGIIGPDIKCMQSMLFIKSAGKPGQAWHQDEDFIPTRDRSLTGGWMSLDKATVENGCLWVIPGSHKAGILWGLEQQSDPNFDCNATSVGFPYNHDEEIPVEVEAGSIVLFNGYLLHRSLPNNAPAGTYRRALVNHYMSANSLLPWTDDLQNRSKFIGEGSRVAQCDFRDVVMIAGKDPYEWLGIQEINKPHVRPSGEGGCA